jgi:hypothetical protein
MARIIRDSDDEFDDDELEGVGKAGAEAEQSASAHDASGATTQRGTGSTGTSNALSSY